jgi:hypothetical protein
LKNETFQISHRVLGGSNSANGLKLVPKSKILRFLTQFAKGVWGRAAIAVLGYHLLRGVARRDTRARGNAGGTGVGIAADSFFCANPPGPRVRDVRRDKTDSMRVADALHAHEWVPGAKAAFEKFADYVPRQEPGCWLAGGKRILVDRIEWNVMPDAATAAAVAADGAPIREMADLGDDAAPPKISEEQADAAEFEVLTPENRLLKKKRDGGWGRPLSCTWDPGATDLGMPTGHDLELVQS